MAGYETFRPNLRTTSHAEALLGRIPGQEPAPDARSPEGGWVVENEGVAPDVEVENWPADLLAGRDPQLEKAIEIALEELKKNPPVKPQRPPYPVRVGKDGR